MEHTRVDAGAIRVVLQAAAAHLDERNQYKVRNLSSILAFPLNHQNI